MILPTRLFFRTFANEKFTKIDMKTMKYILASALCMLVSTACSGNKKSETNVNGQTAEAAQTEGTQTDGKTLIPFTTHEGSGLGSCVKDLKEAFPKATVTEGFSMYGHDARDGKPRVEKWLKKIWK